MGILSEMSVLRFFLFFGGNAHEHYPVRPDSSPHRSAKEDFGDQIRCYIEMHPDKTESVLPASSGITATVNFEASE